MIEKKILEALLKVKKELNNGTFPYRTNGICFAVKAYVKHKGKHHIDRETYLEVMGWMRTWFKLWPEYSGEVAFLYENRRTVHSSLSQTTTLIAKTYGLVNMERPDLGFLIS